MPDYLLKCKTCGSEQVEWFTVDDNLSEVLLLTSECGHREFLVIRKVRDNNVKN